MSQYQEIRNYYNREYSLKLSEAYPRDEERYQSWLSDVLSLDPHLKRVLDIGCGTGFMCSFLYKKGYEVYGCDISDQALKLAHHFLPEGHFRLAEEDGKLNYADGYFDMVTCLGVLEHTLEPIQILREAARVLKKGGYGIFVLANAMSPLFGFGGTGQIKEKPRSYRNWRRLFDAAELSILSVRRDSGPTWHSNFSKRKKLKIMIHHLINLFPKLFTYQFVFTVRK